MMRKRSAVLIGAGLLLGLVVAAPLLAGSKVTVGRSWPRKQQVPIEQVDHSSWNALLARYVDENGMVDYGGWQSSATDRRALDDYLASLSRANPQLSAAREVRLAFWINAYNALTIKGILREYPTTSIRNHTPLVFGYHIWKDLLLVIGDDEYSLSQIEHEVLRKTGDPRIHFGIVCASVGCPQLLNEALVPDRIDEQLTMNARQFFADPTKFNYDASRRKINVSPILNWFAADFGADAQEQMAAIVPYLPDKGSRKLASSGQATLSYLPYDWDLNDQATHGRTSKRP